MSLHAVILNVTSVVDDSHHRFAALGAAPPNSDRVYLLWLNDDSERQSRWEYLSNLECSMTIGFYMSTKSTEEGVEDELNELASSRVMGPVRSNNARSEPIASNSANGTGQLNKMWVLSFLDALRAQKPMEFSRELVRDWYQEYCYKRLSIRTLLNSEEATIAPLGENQQERHDESKLTEETLRSLESLKRLNEMNQNRPRPESVSSHGTTRFPSPVPACFKCSYEPPNRSPPPTPGYVDNLYCLFDKLHIDRKRQAEDAQSEPNKRLCTDASSPMER